MPGRTARAKTLPAVTGRQAGSSTARGTPSTVKGPKGTQLAGGEYFFHPKQVMTMGAPSQLQGIQTVK